MRIGKEKLSDKVVRLRALILCCTLLGACSQQDTRTQAAQQLIDQALASDRAYELVESLTTEVGPRLAGTPADLRAVNWAKSNLEQLGFDEVWLEPVTFPVWQRIEESAEVLTPYPQKLQITALGYSGSTGGELIADVIAFEDLEKLRNTNERHIQGKIVFINQRMPRSRDGSGYGETRPIRSNGVNIARSKGAAAVLIRSVGTDNNRTPHTGSTYHNENQIPAAALSNPDADQLQRILAHHGLVTLSLNIQTSYQEQGHSSNVIAQINGRETPQEILVMGAHLDSWDLGTGAIDDGAGVAIVTTAAHLIAQQPKRPKRSIRVVLFANEEQGEWGGKQYAETHKDELGNYIFASESDFGDGPIYQFDVSHPKFVQDVRPLLKQLDIVVGGPATRGGGDIAPIQNLGVPVISFKQDGSNYFDYHHTANDTLDKVTPEFLQQNVAAWASIYYLAAESDFYFDEKTQETKN